MELPPVRRCETFHFRTDLSDLADNFMAENERKLRVRQFTAMTWRSVRQTAHAATRTSIWPAAGRGVGTSVHSSGRPGELRSIARILRKGLHE